MDKHSPLPWAVRSHLPDAHFDVVTDTFGNTVGTATRPDDADLIVEAVNERDRLRALVRRLHQMCCEDLARANDAGRALLREAREALGEAAP